MGAFFNDKTPLVTKFGLMRKRCSEQTGTYY